MTSLQNLFVAKLPRTVTDADLEKIFESYNPKSAKVMLDAATGKSKGFGFVLFDSEEEGDLAYKELNKTCVTLRGHSFNLCIFPSKHDGKVAKEVSNALYIRNIPQRLSQVEVENFLRNFGNLTYCAIRGDHYGSPVWVVYAEYETIEDAKNALSKLHGNHTYFMGSAALLAKYADTEENKRERRRRRREQHQLELQNHITNSYTPISGSPSSHLGPKLPHSINHLFSPSPEDGRVVVVDRLIGVPFMQHFSSFGVPAPAHDAVSLSTQPPQYPHPSSDSTILVGGTGGSAPTAPLPADVLPTTPIPPLASTFLNVTFPTMASVNSGHSTQMSAHEQYSADRPTSVTPLSFSLEPDAALDASSNFPSHVPLLNVVPCGAGGGNTDPSVETPVARSGTLSARGSMHYRHNPYSLLTPISSAPGTPSPSTPRSTVPMLSAGVLTHFGSNNNNNCPGLGNNNTFSTSTSNNTSGFLCSAQSGMQNGGFTGYSHTHFARSGSHGVLTTSSMNTNSPK